MIRDQKQHCRCDKADAWNNQNLGSHLHDILAEIADNSSRYCRYDNQHGKFAVAAVDHAPIRHLLFAALIPEEDNHIVSGVADDAASIYHQF